MDGNKRSQIRGIRLTLVKNDIGTEGRRIDFVTKSRVKTVCFTPTRDLKLCDLLEEA